MGEFIGFTITGLVTASIYALVACGLTLTYTTTGIFNWAHGAFAAIGAYAYWQLTGPWGWPKPLALLVCVGILGPLVGFIVEAAIMRRLGGTNEITRMAVTLALLVGIVAALNWIWDPRTAKVVAPLFDGRAVHLVGQRIPLYDLFVTAVGLSVALVLRLILYRSRPGVQMRAVVDDPTLVTLNGVSAVRTARLSWGIGATTAVLAGILIAPKTSVAASALALLIMNAFAAAVIGRLRSLPLTVLGAVILGLATAYAQGYIGSRPDFPGGQYLIGLVNIVPAIVLFIALQFLPHTRLRAARSVRARELTVEQTWRSTGYLVAAVVIITGAVAPLVGPGDLHFLTRVWTVGLIGLSLVPLLGWAGRLSVCPLAFAAVGALISAHQSPDGRLRGLVLAVLGTALVGALLSLTAVRLSPLYLALATAAFAVALENWVFKLPPFDIVLRIPFTDQTLYRHELDLFQQGTLTVPRPRIVGIDLGGDQAFLVFSAIVFALVLVALTALRRSGLGLRMLALRESPIGYATVGLDRRVTTVAAFAISAGIAGLGGALHGAAIQRPGPDAFGFFGGLSILIVVVIFGISSLGSPIAAGALLGTPVLANLFPTLAQLTPALTATAGVGLGDDPNGVIASQLAPTWRGVARRPIVLAGGLTSVTVVWLGALTGLVSNWAFGAVAVAFVAVMPWFGRRSLAVSGTGDRAGAGTVAVASRSAEDRNTTRRPDGLSDHPEVLSLDTPLAVPDRVALDRLLGLSHRAGPPAPAGNPGDRP